MRATATKERPILMCGQMVRMTLADLKTQTRRVVKPQPKTEGIAGVRPDPYNREPEWGFWLPDGRLTEPRTWRCPYGVPGDRLWVRETWLPSPGGAVVYRASYEGDAEPGLDIRYDRWRPSIFMPRWTSRITLEITGVRVQRVREITEDDAKAEGVTCMVPSVELLGEYRVAYKHLWDSLNAKRGYGWDRNPWVWVLEFRRVIE